jgi:hypothetical protein
MAFEDLKIEMKCKDFRIEVEEGLKGDSLSIVAQDHAAGCRPCREFNQKHIEFREWLTVCRKVTAPKDFGFGVQRKIADAGASHTHGWAWDRLRYIVPTTALAAVMVLVGSYALFNNRNLPDDQVKAAISNTERVADQAAQPGNSIPVQGDPGAVKQPGEEKIASVANSNKQENSKVAPQKDGTLDSEGIPGRHLDLAANSEGAKYPEGINPAKNDPAKLSNLLMALSAEGIVVNLDMKVISLKANAPAGVQVRDVVESLNGKIVTVRRGRQTLQIALK